MHTTVHGKIYNRKVYLPGIRGADSFRAIGDFPHNFSPEADYTFATSPLGGPVNFPMYIYTSLEHGPLTVIPRAALTTQL